jgi:hypothetical protein
MGILGTKVQPDRITKEPLIYSGLSRLGAKKVRFKAPIARDSGAIVKIGNTEAGFFGLKIQVHE